MAITEKSPLEAFWAWIRGRMTTPANGTPGSENAAQHVVVWRQDGSDDRSWFEVLRRDDGLHSFEEWRREHVSDPITGDHEHKFLIFESGLYKSEDEAIAAARAYIQDNAA